MSTHELTDGIRAFLKQPLPCVIATLGRKGQPVTAASWFEWRDDDTILLNIEVGRARIRHVEADPRVALTILGESWYQTVSIQGRVTSMYDDPDLADIDRISRHYSGNDYPVRDKGRLTMVVTIDSLFTRGVK